MPVPQFPMASMYPPNFGYGRPGPRFRATRRRGTCYMCKSTNHFCFLTFFPGELIPLVALSRGMKNEFGNIKKIKFMPEIPDWELSFDFDPMNANFRSVFEWVNYRGKILQPPFHYANVDAIVSGEGFDFEQLAFRNPDNFVAGNLHKHLDFWETVTNNEEVLDWLRNGVYVEKYFKPFKGNFKGRPYDSLTPSRQFFPNALNCRDHVGFIVQTLLDRIANGSLSIWGKVGFCDPPHIVMPLTVEPSKPRLCHDERYLNLWIIDKPFILDTLKEVPRIIKKGSFMTSLDNKSGYDHILLSETSRKFFGGGILSTTLYPLVSSLAHTLGYCRKLEVPCLLYIDDRLVSEFLEKEIRILQGRFLAFKSLYIVCNVLVRLGYFISLSKSVFEPSQVLRFLGMLVDSEKQSFLLPSDKRQRFASLRDNILNLDLVDLKTLQRFAGKCISFMLAVPAAKLYIREVNIAIGFASKNSKKVKVSGSLRSEIQYWKFLDNWTGFIPWRQEKHLQICMATDASNFRWGAIINDVQSCGDFFDSSDFRPIHLKEATALLNTLVSIQDTIRNARVDVFVDNKAVVDAWEGQGSKSSALNNYIKAIFSVVQRQNVDLHLEYIPSAVNPADYESRRLSMQDCKLSSLAWKLVQDKFGPHSVDLMSTDSNAMVDGNGNLLKHYTRWFITLGKRGDDTIILRPSKKGFIPYRLDYNLYAAQLVACGVPRIWKPAILCPTCSYANDADFRFCQFCGEKCISLDNGSVNALTVLSSQRLAS
ncbi:hypothetical protein KUTeg_011601 [Tegillarca granosa]|uniref:Reverse transcriptase domain-containing protein n=1 Tax=Tegillarca granosa TaxID=220873 RepID=A0ABQ9EZJ7_TEGGR|nr:hypothetical protein KUTeg_011601 [Tegillarca granosa]